MVGDRGMLTSARMEALKEVGGVGWISALRSIQIEANDAARSIGEPLFGDEASRRRFTPEQRRAEGRGWHQLASSGLVLRSELVEFDSRPEAGLPPTQRWEGALRPWFGVAWLVRLAGKPRRTTCRGYGRPECSWMILMPSLRKT